MKPGLAHRLLPLLNIFSGPWAAKKSVEVCYCFALSVIAHFSSFYSFKKQDIKCEFVSYWGANLS